MIQKNGKNNDIDISNLIFIFLVFLDCLPAYNSNMEGMKCLKK